MNIKWVQNQLIPLTLTVVILFALIIILWSEISILNLLTLQKIILSINIFDILVGTTIYLKTSIDFGIFMGNLMRANPGWKNRVAIEIGTAVGNASGTFIILAIWTFFKEVDWLLGVMVFLASLVLLQLAADGLDHAKVYRGKFAHTFKQLVSSFGYVLTRVNMVFAPFLSRAIPHLSMNAKPSGSWKKLFSFSFTVPFILGLDDFAGYVPLFSIVNVFGFAIGVLMGHMILNVFLFINPRKTVAAVSNPLISFAGSIAFVLLAVVGFKEAFHLLIGH